MQRGIAATIFRVILILAFVPLGAPASATWAADPTATPPPEPGQASGAAQLSLPEQPPIVIAQTPAPGEEHPIDRPIGLTFDQPMDEPSVAAALTISPTVEGGVQWSGNTLEFTPAAPGFTRGQEYHVTLTDAARSKGGKALAIPVDFRFQTVGFVEVAEVLPAGGTSEVEMDATVTVIFNRPVVPLASLGQQASLPQPLTFTPPVQGQGEWRNTSIFVFTPQPGFQPATTYKARIAGGLSDTMGGLMPDDFVWDFTTVRPRVLTTIPVDNAVFRDPTTPITVTFNQPMDRASAEAAFTLIEVDTGQAVQGTFGWSTGETEVEQAAEDDWRSPDDAPQTVRGESMVFRPTEPLSLETVFRGMVAAGAKAARGDSGTTTDTTWTFTTVGLPAIKETNPENGDKKAALAGVQLSFTAPISRSTLGPNLTIVPTATNVYSYWSRTDTQVDVWWDMVPSTAYTVTVGRNVESRAGYKLGKNTAIKFTTRPETPSIGLFNTGRVGTYSVYTNTMAYVSYRNVNNITYRLFKLDAEELYQLTGDRQWEVWDDFKPKPRNLLRTWGRRVTSSLNEWLVVGTAVTTKEGEPLAPGMYFLEVTAPGATSQRQVMIVSQYNIILKQGDRNALAWVTDLKSGQPAPDVEMRFFGEDGHPLGSGRTDADGVFQADYEKVDPWKTMYAFAGDESGTGFGLVTNKWNDGINAWDFNINGEIYGNDYQGTMYTDRPIYRPGQKVFFKGIVRRDDWSRYSLLEPGHPVTVTVSNSNGEEIFREVYRLNDMGTFNGDLMLAESAPLGDYFIQGTIIPDEATVGVNFTVAEYRRPQFEVGVTSDKPEYLNGERIAVTAKAEYYFGGPVADAAVKWTVLGEDASFQWKGEGWYDFTDYDWTTERNSGYYGGVVTEGEGKTNAQGEFVFNVPANIAEQINSQRYTIEATVTDVNDQAVSANTAVIVHKGLFYIGLAPAEYLAKVNEEAQVNVITVGWDSAPAPSVTATLVFMEHKWFSVEEKAEDGSFYWTSKYVDTPIYTGTVQTGPDGKVSTSFVPTSGGVYKIVATAEDEKGNTVRSSTFLWVTSSDFVNWRQENNDRIELIADKKSYQVGDEAQVLIPSPYQGSVTALLTIERGRVLSHRLMTLASNSEQVAIPILPDYVPDAFVSVVLIKGQDASNPLASFKIGYVTLPVSTEQKQLKITLKPDRDVYQPGDTATYDVTATDYAGKGVVAELSLNLVDKSVLALADSQAQDLMDVFWRERGVGVQTSASLVLSVDRRNLEVAPSAKGGGGGDGGAGTVRRRFPDTAYWNPVVLTDSDGKAQIKVVLPDTLTAWNMSTRGITAQTEVGEAQVDIRSTKPLHVRSVLPRFFVAGDEAQIGSIVHNETDQSFGVQVDLLAEGLDVVTKTQRIGTVPAHSQVRVDWPVTALDTAGAKIRFSVKSTNLQDAEEFTLPILRYTSPETVGTAGQLSKDETRTELVQLPTRLDATQGELRMEIDPSLAAGMEDGLRYLQTYPYLCIEQTVSRFLPNVMTWRALQELGITDPELEEKLPEYVTAGLQRIYALQHTDGGWGWWLADQSNPFISAYVVFGMNQAFRAGFSVERDVMDKGIAYLTEAIGKGGDAQLGSNLDAQAFVLYVMADAEKGDVGRTSALFGKRATMSQYGKAFTALAMHKLDAKMQPRVNTLLSDLNNAAIASATGIHWEEAEQDRWTMNTDTRTTAIVLEALVTLRPDSQLIPNVVRWLMSNRRAGHWESTQETAWSVMALTDYMKASGELEGDYRYQVLLNGAEWAAGQVSRDNIDRPELLQSALADLKRDVVNQVSIVRLPPEGAAHSQGQLYYSMHLKYYLPVPDIKALNRGVILARQYSPVDQPEQFVDGARVGDVIQVKLTIVAPNDLHYVVVEDPLPAGCEALDQSLKTTSIVGEQPELQRTGQRDPWGWWYFSQTEVHDDRVALFATYLPKGTYEYTYLMRASLAGDFRVMPSTAYEMYFPEVFGRGDGGVFTVERGQ